MFGTFAVNVPATQIILGANPPEDKSFGLGVQGFVYRLIGTIPAPVIFGSLMDRVCLVSAFHCGDYTEGSCSIYKSGSLMTTLV